MAVAKVGASVGIAGAMVAPVGNPTTLAVPTGGYPVGTVITAFGWTLNGVTSVTDARGNTWNRRMGDTAYVSSSYAKGLFLFDCLVTNALSAGDLISLTRSGTAAFGWIIQGWSGCDAGAYFDGVSEPAIFTTTAALCNLMKTTVAGNAVFAWFMGQGGSAAVCTITTAGGGFTNETGYTNGGPEGYLGVDWESKIAGAAGTEQPNCTWAGTPIASPAAVCAFAAYGGPHVGSSVGVN